jgi:predicted transcriptional regulator
MKRVANRTPTVGVAITRDIREKLDMLAASRWSTRSTVARRLIEEGLARYGVNDAAAAAAAPSSAHEPVETASA